MTEITETSPKLCKPYLQFRQTVAPYLDPYYNIYAKPYFDELRPYTDKISRDIITPVSTFTTSNYKAYVAPKVAQSQKYALKQWDANVAPQLITAQARAKAQYAASLGPHVDKAWTAADPHYRAAVSTSSDFYNSRLLPAYYYVLPYGQQAYEQGHHYAVNVGYPYAQYAWSSTSAFLGRTIWPQLRILYGENVEPQLVRISERLGRYRDGKRIEEVVEHTKPLESPLSGFDAYVYLTAI